MTQAESKGGRVKGIGFIGTLNLVRGLVERGVMSSDALSARLSGAALELLEEKVEPSLWYSLTAVDELTKIVVEFIGDGDPRYLRELGRGSLSGLLERDSFRNLIDGASKQKGREGQSLVGLASLIYDFGEWHFDGEDLGDFTLTATDVALLPELARETIAGFIQTLVEHCTGERVDLESTRPEPDRIQFRATSARTN